MEKAETCLLAGMGAAQGIYRYYVKPELTAKNGWLAIGAFVVAFDMLGQETLSSYAKARCEASVWPRAAIGYLGLHLSGLIPEQIDPLTQLHNAIRGNNEAPTTT